MQDRARILTPKGDYSKLLDGRILEIDPELYNYVLDEEKPLEGVPVCICCGKRLYTDRERGISEIESKPGFHHVNKTNKNCPQVHAEMMLFRGVYKNSFDALEKKRNSLALKKWEKHNDETIRFFMQRLTGQRELSKKDKKILGRVKHEMRSMVGLADYPWALPYIQALVVGTRVREMSKTKHNRRVGYKWAGGVQEFAVKGMNGKRYTLYLPGKLQLCFINHAGRESSPLVSAGKFVEFDVSEVFVGETLDSFPARSKLNKTQRTLPECLP